MISRSAVYLTKLACPKARPILVHNVNRGFFAHLIGKKIYNLKTACLILRQNKMPYQEALYSSAIFNLKVADLPVHFQNSFLVNLRIISGR